MNFIIDTDHYADAGITTLQFPGGEWHANVPAWPFKSVNVHAKIRSWDDFGKLLVVLSALKHQHVEVHLFMPYAPGLRQDRNPGGLTPLTPEVYGGALGQFVKSITVADPHSENGVDILRRSMGKNFVKALAPSTYLPDLLPLDHYDYVVQPDAGAEDRTKTTADILGLGGTEILKCTKHREFGTGKLSGFAVPQRIASYDAGTKILIPDDICDGGGTFLGLLAEIKACNHDVVVDLFVTHGIFSNGALVRLLEYYTGGNQGFNHIYTTDSFFNTTEVNVTSISLLPYYLGGLHP